MSSLPPAYDPKSIEEAWLKVWEKSSIFKANAASKKKSFSIVIPPPNVTGVLHIGHALVNTLQDILVRWHRMCGEEVLWVPGTDHAGISTQLVVEKQLFAKTGKKRHDINREEFLSLAWEWKKVSEKEILNQIKRLGCSCDFSRLAFTMDETRNRAVRTFFKKLYDQNLIYRGDYLVNWDPVTQTALSDDEVDEVERQSSLWHIAYPVEGMEDALTVATTRPETMLGDTAVAVNPTDERYKKFIGRTVLLPLVNRRIPVIADSFVDPSFGTGAVKVTPAHDFTDFDVGRRHQLPMINIMTPDGRIKEGLYAGLSMAEAREAIVRELNSSGLLKKTTPHTLRLRISERTKAEIQPYLSKQWFVKAGPFKEKLIDAVKKKKVKLVPPHWDDTYFHWIENLRDWCISRQLLWGHRIPIWYKGDQQICYDGPGEPPEAKEGGWVQDPDVLDTWFSSALWPLSVFGWPEATADFKKFYPTSTLITGHDILFFWVARMILAGEFLTGELPFKEVFLHGLIYGKSYWRIGADGLPHYIMGEEKQRYDLDEKAIPKEVEYKWEKMSKSKGNVIDPIEMIQAYGCDALRLTLASIATHARQIDLDPRRFEEFKNFANKIWNGSRFVFLTLEKNPLSGGLDLTPTALEDRWILSAFNRTANEMNRLIKDYAFDQAALLAYRFFWNEFCATYLEIAKRSASDENKKKLLVILLLGSIRLLHPIAPFITEEIFSTLRTLFSSLEGSAKNPYAKEALTALKAPLCALSPYPSFEPFIDDEAERLFAEMEKIVHAIRNIRAEMSMAPSEKTELFLIDAPSQVKENAKILLALTPTQAIHYATAEPKGHGSSCLVGSMRLFIPLPAAMLEKEKIRLEKEKEKCLKLIEGAKGKLSQEDFLSRAPKEVVEKLKDSVAQMERQLGDIHEKLRKL